MKKIFIPIMLVLAATLVFAKADTASVAVLQFKDIFWCVENDYAVIVGNIYDYNEGNVYDYYDEKWAESGVMAIPAEINGFPVKIFDGHFDMFSPEKVALPEGLTTIRKGAFNCSPIIELKIPSTVTLIEPGAIRYCNELEKIDVDPNNINYTVINGLLYTKDGKELLYCPPKIETDDGTLIIPSGTEKVQSYAFTTCSVEALIFQEGLTVLEDYALVEGWFRSVYFPSTLEYMGDYSFCSVGNESVYFQTDLPKFGENVFASSTNTKVFIGDSEGIPVEDLNSARGSQPEPSVNNKADIPKQTDEPEKAPAPGRTNEPEKTVALEQTDEPEKADMTVKKQALIVLIPVLILGIVLVTIYQCNWRRKR